MAIIRQNQGYNEQEIYETSDTESINEGIIINEKSILPNTETVNDPENFNFQQPSISNLKTKFSSQYIYESEPDFSDTIYKKKESYKTFQVEETYNERLKRIKQELEEMATMKEIGGLEGKEPIEDLNVEELNKMMKCLEKVEKKPEINIKSVPQLKIDKLKISEIESNNELADPLQVKELEERIFKLEKIIGFDPNTTIINDDTNFQNIESIISDLDRKIKVLINLDSGIHDNGEIGNKELLEDLIKKMEILNKEIIFNNKKLSTNQAFYLNNSIPLPNNHKVEDENSINGKINKLYNSFLGNNQTMMTPEVLSNLLKRLNTLNTLFLEYETTVHLSKNSDSLLEKLNDDFKSWQKSLKLANDNLKNLTQDLSENSQEIKNWLESLQ